VTATDYAYLIFAVAIGVAVLALIGYWAMRYLIASDYVITASFKVAKRALPVARPPAPKVVIVPGNGVPDSLTSDIVVKGDRF
jgi:hypothetical protein